MDVALDRQLVIPQLWLSYKKTSEYKQGMTQAIPAHHKLVEAQERIGLRSIYQSFVNVLAGKNPIRQIIKNRKPADWLSEWKGMHRSLFEHILLTKGMWRQVDVRFGDPGDEELYNIPKHQLVSSVIGNLAEQVAGYVAIDNPTEEEKYKILARVHYEFVRVHPFADGNGRIARAITDQLSLYFGFPPAMGGYPRHDPKNRKAYHTAIRSCVDQPDCTQLALWIKSYIDKQLQRLA